MVNIVVSLELRSWSVRSVTEDTTRGGGGERDWNGEGGGGEDASI